MPTLKLSTTDDSGASPLAKAMKQRRRQLATVLGRQLVDEWRWKRGSVRVTSAVSRLAHYVGPLGVSG